MAENVKAIPYRHCKRAVEEPLRQIVCNCGLEGSVVVQNIKQGKKLL